MNFLKVGIVENVILPDAFMYLNQQRNTTSITMSHLRPHPAFVKSSVNVNIKNTFKQKTDKYTYAFNNRSYVDFDIYNILKKSTVDRSGVCSHIQTSTKPVIFFMCYDVGYNTTLKTFIRHVVCCVAFPGDTVKILFFDMRNLCDISPTHQELIETEISRKCGKPVELINASCLGSECLYLQKFKGENEVGWCVGWALYFLNMLTSPLFRGKYVADMTEFQYKLHISKLYEKIYGVLSSEKSNHFIEKWYTSQLA